MLDVSFLAKELVLQIGRSRPGPATETVWKTTQGHDTYVINANTSKVVYWYQVKTQRI